MIMATMGKFCKAYSLAKMREFSGWSEKAENAQKEKQEENDQEIEATRKLTNDSFLYLQENYVVTDGVFKDENIIFDFYSKFVVLYFNGFDKNFSINFWKYPQYSIKFSIFLFN